MKTRTVLLMAFGLVALAVPFAHADYAGCVTISPGLTACGEVTPGACGAGSGSGQATGSVHWVLRVDTNHDDATDEATGPAAALAATASCWTDTCTTVSLYADDHYVTGTPTLC